MNNTIRQNKAFLIPYSILLTVGLFIVFKFTKAEIHLAINQYHSSWANVLFSILTYFGDGIMLPLYVLIMVCIKYRYAILLILVFLISGLVVQILKRFVFADIVRPIEYFKDLHPLYLVPGIVQNCCKSFPSGHTATAFSLMFTFSIAIKNNYLKFFTLVFAVLIAYSRMYLSQHFLVDLIAGSVLGLATTYLLNMVILKYKAPWLDYSVFTQLKLKHKKEN